MQQLGIAAAALGDLDTATAAFERELDACRRLGDRRWESGALSNLAEAELRRGMVAAAAGHQRECLGLALELGAPGLVAFSLIVAARLEALEERWEEATILHAQAESIIDELGLMLYEGDQRQSDVMLEQAHHALGDARYEPRGKPVTPSRCRRRAPGRPRPRRGVRRLGSQHQP